jgi:hypothetical protein
MNGISFKSKSKSVYSIFIAIPLVHMLFVSSLVTCDYFRNTDAAYIKAKPDSGGPIIKDPNLKVEVVFKNSDELDLPITSMAFLGHNDILVLEKNKGTVQRILNGHLESEPLLEVQVGDEIEWGMLGIATTENAGKTYAFVYYTEAGNDGEVLGNRLYYG